MNKKLINVKRDRDGNLMLCQNLEDLQDFE